MVKQFGTSLLLASTFISGCAGGDGYSGKGYEEKVQIPQFNFPNSTTFAPLLSDYNIFAGNASLLQPTNGWNELHLSSVLYTDNAYKQRLVKLPAGTVITLNGDEMPNFPNGTILTKTFYYLADERLGDDSTKQIVETRLLIKEQGYWNAATYVWNAEQSDAVLTKNGVETEVTWLDGQGARQSIDYHVPSQNDCAACHQQSNAMTPLGPTLRNLNRDVEVQGQALNQLDYLYNLGVLSRPSNTQANSPVASMVDYTDATVDADQRARAYLAMNCSHCHRPVAWEATAGMELDFRYQLPLSETGIHYSEDKIKRALESGEMPFTGTTTIDSEGVALVVNYLERVKDQRN